MMQKIICSILAWTRWLLAGTGSSITPDTTQQSKEAPDSNRGNEKHQKVIDEILQAASSHEVVDLPVDNPHRKTPDITKGKQNSTKPKLPREIGGRRRTGEQKVMIRQPPKPCPELICREDVSSRQWELILHVKDECQVKEVYQKGAVLTKFNYDYRLLSFTNPLRIVFENGEEEDLQLFEGKPLIFKIRNGWKGDGRKTAVFSAGNFIVIAPSEWQQTGHVPFEPEACTDSHFKAYYFCREADDSKEDIGGFSQCALPTKSIFELTGERVYDDSDEGELFVGAIPNLKPLQAIAWARIGEEKKDGWQGETFNPNEQSIANVLNNREGHFFLRVYDREAKLLDSGEFRYLRDLIEVIVNGQPYNKNMPLVPPPTGYSTINVSFISKNHTTLRPVLEHDEKHVKAQGSNLTVKAHPSGDSISCMLESSTGSVDLKLNLPRVWWKLTCDNSWRDTPLEMTQQEFRKYAKQNAAIELRLPRRIRSVGVGFNDELERKYQRYMAQDSVSLPMKNFSDYSQIDQRLMEDALFNIRCDKEVLTLIKISADHAPNSDIQNTTKNITVFPIFKQGGKLAAIVRTSNNGWRQSRGFSVGEVRGADLTVDECRRREIRIDKRRRTAHPNNIQVIRRLVDVKRNTGLG